MNKYTLLITKDRLADNSIVNFRAVPTDELILAKAQFKRAFNDKSNFMGVSPQDYFVEAYPIELNQNTILIDGAQLEIEGDK